MGEARRKAEAAAGGRGGTANGAAFLREAERREQEVKRCYAEEEPVLRPTMLEAVDIEEAIEDPAFGRLVAYGVEVAELVASGEPSSHGAAACMTCGTSWTPESPPVVAVIGTVAGKKVAGLVCAACAEVGQERFMAEKLQPLLRSQGERDVRLVRPAPGGSA